MKKRKGPMPKIRGQSVMYVQIVEGCIACGVCESLCPDVFTVLETSVADNTQVPGHEDAVREASDACPVNVIKVEE